MVPQIHLSRWKYFYLSCFSIPLNVIGAFVMLLQVIIFYSFQYEKALSTDLYFYGEISTFLAKGYENIYGVINTMNVQEFPTASPYHYFDIWFTSFFSSLFSLSDSKVLLLVTYPVLLTGYLSGIFAIAKKYVEKLTIYHYLLIPLFLFIGPVIVVHYNSIFETGIIIFENIGFFDYILPFSFFGQKHLVFYIISVLFFNLFLNGNKKEAFLVLCFAPVVNIGLFPGVIGGFFLYQLIFYKNLNVLKKPLLPFFLLLILIPLFYFLMNLGKDSSRISEEFLYSFRSHLNLNGEIIRFILRIVIAVCWLILLYLVYVLLFLFTPFKILKSEFNVPVLLGGCFCMVAVLTRPFLVNFDGAQFLVYLLPFINCTFVIIVLYSLSKSKYKILVLSMFLVIVSFNVVMIGKTSYQKNDSLQELYSTEYLSQVTKYLDSKNPKNTNYGYLLDSAIRKNIPPGFWYAQMPMDWVKLKNFHNCYSLNFPFDQHDVKSISASSYANHQFLLSEKHMSENKFYDQLTTFIHQYQIRFVVSDNQPFTDAFKQEYVSREIVDSFSGEIFYIMKDVVN
jgi:hypothetical protein